jgi:hypothetical protein
VREREREEKKRKGGANKTTPTAYTFCVPRIGYTQLVSILYLSYSFAYRHGHQAPFLSTPFILWPDEKKKKKRNHKKMKIKKNHKKKLLNQDRFM